jgi:hypothetical protein
VARTARSAARYLLSRIGFRYARRASTAATMQEKNAGIPRSVSQTSVTSATRRSSAACPRWMSNISDVRLRNLVACLPHQLSDGGADSLSADEFDEDDGGVRRQVG